MIVLGPMPANLERIKTIFLKFWLKENSWSEKEGYIYAIGCSVFLLVYIFTLGSESGKPVEPNLTTEY